MNKILLLTAAIMMTTTVAAHEKNNITFSGDNCEVEFQNDVRITPDNLVITTAKNKTAEINNLGELTLNGERIALNTQQKTMLTQYGDELRGRLPQVADIAFEGIKLAGVALNEVAHTFNLTSLDSIHAVIDDLETEVQNTFYQQGAFVMGKQTFDEFGQNFDNQFEEKIETAVQGAMMQSIGSLLVAIGNEMSDANGDMSSFEQRMENFATQIETKVEQQAESIEKKADALCGDFEQIAKNEAIVAKSIPAMSEYQLFKFK
ncbi:hypothetical protein CKO50_03840 [Pseudoalteromonas sp. HM-SA03]|uniref:YggN family protein n=1 Tax=Pseudoalteromonas sp. HM-SA03 TaxID=2029678 RepID=UPI000BAE30D8|nr:YggN family protein [Pseudoalteromonas sp. HM-SA03]PAY02638.1 hypothetical protein CKO50_03840 [Pseudoalteromonas sp. HM-SA03]